MFRRRRKAQEAASESDDLTGEAAEDSDEGVDDELEAAPPPPSRPQGPWDVADAPAVAEGVRTGGTSDGDDNRDDDRDDDQLDGIDADEGSVATADPDRLAGRAPAKELDLGGLRLPVVDGVEIRVEFGSDQQIAAATLVQGGSQLQVMAFAAPRSQGLWAEIRTEIADAVRGDGGSADERDGAFGPELVAEIPVEVPGHGRARQAVRFIGVDAPRWFLRGLFSGPAATDHASAKALEDCFRQIVVVRGDEAMAPRDPLPLRLPRDAAGVGLAPDDPAGSGALPFDPFERGPEITEVY